MAARCIDTESRIVIIGAGVVGAALADDLARLGQSSVTVVDQGPLFKTGGSSSHAPGFAFQTTGSEVMTELARRTLDKLDGLDLDGDWILKRVGGIEIACDEERARYLQRRYGLARSWGVPAEMISGDQVGDLFPGLDPTSIHAALHTPTDGVVKAVRAVEWQARRAVKNGAVFYGHTRVTGFRIVDGRIAGVDVERTPEVPSRPSKGDALPEGTNFIEADIVVVCAGLWGPQLGELVGLELPMVPMEHCSASTSPVPALSGFDLATEVARPMIRHQATGSYFRQEGERYTWGTYEHRVIPLEQEDIASPERFAETGLEPAIHPVTWDDLDDGWREMQRLLPECERLERVDGFNGIFSFTPDGNPLIGEVDHVKGLWLAESVWLTQSAGVAGVVADWIVTGDPGVDTTTLDYRRFDQTHLTRTVSIALSSENYDEVYDIAHPRKQSGVLRRFSITPFYLRQEQCGAHFAVHLGAERPLWYRKEQAAHDQRLDVLSWGSYGWAPEVAQEARAVMERGGILDGRFGSAVQVSGADARLHLEGLARKPLPVREGASSPALLFSADGRILADTIIVKTGPEMFLVLGTGPADRTALASGGAARDVRLTDVNSATVFLSVAGPRAADCLTALARRHIFTAHAPIPAIVDLAGVPARVIPDETLGVDGWTILVAPEHSLYLWDALVDEGRVHGIEPAGSLARTTLRIAAGIPTFGIDYGQRSDPSVSGLEGYGSPAGDESGPGMRVPVAGRVLVQLRVDLETAAIVSDEPVLSCGRVVGYVTSAAPHPLDGHHRAFAWVDVEAAVPGRTLVVASLGEEHAATVDRSPVAEGATV